MNEYQNTYEKEINLMELMVYCLKKWRWILISMLIVGVLAGGYKYWSISKSNQAALANQKEQQEEAEKEDNIGEENIGLEDFTERYELVIQENLENLENQEEYMKDSVIMELDANHLPTGVLTLYLEIDETEVGTNALDTLITAYYSYAIDGRLAQEMAEVDVDVSEADLQYLLSFSNRQSSASGAIVAQLESVWPTQNVIEFRVVARDKATCEKYLEAMQEAILAYGRELQRTLVSHEVQVLASTYSERINTSILDYQKQILASYTATFKNLQALQTELKTYVETQEEAEKEKEEEAVTLASPVSGAVKFAVVGVVLGVCLAGFAAILVYITSGKLQSVECFEEEFGMKLLGRVSKASGKKNAIDRLVYRLEEGAYAELPYEEQIKIVAANVKAASKGLQKIMLAGTMSEKVAEEFCVRLKAEIAEVEFSEYKQLVFCAAALEDLGAYDAVLFLEKKEVSVAKLIRREKELAETRNVKVIGAVAV